MGSLGLGVEKRRMVVVLMVGAMLVVLNQTLLSPALPSIMANLDVDETTVQWLTSAYALVEAVVIPLAAWFMGRFSTRVLYIGCMALFTAGTLVAAAAPLFSILLLGRVLQASATGIMMVVVLALLMLAFPRESRGQAMGIFSLVISFSPAVGPTVGGILVDLVGWRALFIVVAAVSLIVILLSHRFLINQEGFPRTSLDTVSVAYSTIGLVLLLYGLSSFASTDHVWLCVILMVVGAVFVGLFVRRQFRLDEPILRLEVLRSRRYRVSFAVVAMVPGILIGLGVLNPLYLQEVLGCSATISGLATLPGASLGAVSGLLAGRIFDRRGVRGVAVIGSSALAIGAIGMCFLGASSALTWFVASYAIACVGMQLIATPLNTWGVNSLDNELVQHATAATNTINQVGGSFGTALMMSFGALGTQMSDAADSLQRTAYGYHWSYVVVLAMAAVVLLLVLFSARNKKSDPVPGTSEAADNGMVSDFMSKDPMAVRSSDRLSDVVKALAESKASGAIVLGDDDKVEGFISSGDVLRFFGDEMQTMTGLSGFMALRMLDDEKLHDRVERLAGMQAIEVATKEVVSIAPDASFEEACRMLADKRLKSLPVTEDGKLLGVLRRSDLMSYIASMIE